MSSKKNSNRYERKQGKRLNIGERKRTISFSWEKLHPSEGQRIVDWENEGLLSDLCIRMQQIGQYESSQALAQQLIKQYTKVGYPDNSKFTKPTHVSPTYWAVIHIKQNSKEVVAGYIENDVFYIVFLDKEHLFWSTDIQSRGKNKR